MEVMQIKVFLYWSHRMANCPTIKLFGVSVSRLPLEPPWKSYQLRKKVLENGDLPCKTKKKSRYYHGNKNK
uniref:Uncharacterized protein n=1 Tax=Anguilla anguilla TaxID=7936 RepID=A0A0E9WT90_ANGAN